MTTNNSLSARPWRANLPELLMLVLAIVASDQISKTLVVGSLGLGQSVPLIPGFLHFTLVRNLHTVTDPHDVLPAVYREQPDVVILDALLPGLSGFDLCKQIKTDGELKGIQVVVVTGVYLRQQYRQEALQHRQVLIVGGDDGENQHQEPEKVRLPGFRGRGAIGHSVCSDQTSTPLPIFSMR